MDIYQTVTDRILQLLEAGTCPWRRSWSGGSGIARNLVSKKPYRGINPFLLAASPFSSPYWLTYRQAVSLGGHVKRGEKSSMVVFWKMLDKKAADQEDEEASKHCKIPMLKFYNVFSVEQCEGLTVPPEPEEVVNEFTSIEKADQIVKGYRGAPVVRHGGNRAFYRPADDIVQMPHPHTFDQSESYFSVFFHELAHSSGAAHRLARKEVTEVNTFGSEPYGVEELVAEFTASYLCAHAGISNQTIDQSASYIDSWMKVLRSKENKKMLVIAAARAQAAADHILGRTFGAEETEPE